MDLQEYFRCAHKGTQRKRATAAQRQGNGLFSGAAARAAVAAGLHSHGKFVSAFECAQKDRLMNALFFATDDAIWHWWILTLSVPGIVQGAQVTVRLALILVMSNVLTCTTPPLEITGAIQTLLSPLRLVLRPRAPR